jgi:hypothetical protein
MTLNLNAITVDVTQVLAAWTAVCSVLSLLNKYGLSKFWPNGARAVSAVLSILPGHIGNAIEDIQAIINDIQSPPAPPAATNGGTQQKPPSKPPAPVATRLGAVGMLVTALGVTGCSKPIVIPPNTPADIEGALACVTAAILAAQPLDDCLTKYGPALVADAIQTLLDSKKFQTDHPDLTPVLLAHAKDLAKLQAAKATK